MDHKYVDDSGDDHQQEHRDMHDVPQSEQAFEQAQPRQLVQQRDQGVAKVLKLLPRGCGCVISDDR